MEARVYYLDGSIEVHRLPELVGDDLVPSPVKTFNIEGNDVPHNDLDRIKAIVETFGIANDGMYMERSIDLPFPNEGFHAVNGGRHYVLSADMLSKAKLVLLDGEQVWPSQDEDRNVGSLDALFMSSQL